MFEFRIQKMWLGLVRYLRRLSYFIYQMQVSRYVFSCRLSIFAINILKYDPLECILEFTTEWIYESDSCAFIGKETDEVFFV